jgi:predicted ATP-dependent endonuclease of OLD family
VIIVTHIQIEKFRSCRSVSITGCENFNILAGKNNSGKSNVLRALNLFFTNETGDENHFDILRDCNARAHEKKIVAVTISFVLDKTIKIQQTIKDVVELIPKIGEFKIKKEFTYSKSAPLNYKISYHLDNMLLSDAQGLLIEQFLHLFNFRYIQSDKSAVSVLQDNLTEIQSELRFRYRSKYRDEKKRKELDKKQTESVAVIKSLATEIFEPISNEMVKADQTIEDVNIGTPNDIIELLNTVSYQVKLRSGIVLSERFQGNGMQCILLYALLYLIDRNYHRKFGWKIATIWAIEEPETFLHHDLENQLANYFSENANVNTERFQLFCTTHSEVFPQYADAHYLVEKQQDVQNNSWSDCKKLTLHDFLFELMKTKITSSINVVSLYPMDKIVLVEGEIDEYVFKCIVEKVGKPNVKVFAISNYLHNTELTGCTQLELFVKTNKNLLKNRTEKNNITIVLDWDVKNDSGIKPNALERTISPPNKIIVLDFAKRNPLLDKTFRGIEAYYPTDYIEQVLSSNSGLIWDKGFALSQNRYHVDPEKYKLIKHNLFKIVKDRGIESSYLEEIVRGI